VLTVQHSTLPADNRVVIEARVLAHSYLAADDALRAELRASRDAGLSGDDGVFADLDVVRDLNQIVELHSPPNSCRLKGPPINARIGADLNVIFDDDPADLRKLQMHWAVMHEAEAVRSNDGTGVNDDAIPNLDILVNNDSGIKYAMVPDLRILADVASRLDGGIITDQDAWFQNSSRSDLNAFSYRRRWGHRRTRVNANLPVCFRQKPCGGFCKRQLWVFDSDDRLLRPLAGPDEDTARSARSNFALKLLLRITEVRWPGILQASNGIYNSSVVATKFASYVFGNFPNGSFHGVLLKYAAI
jgi:hypothetical protein